MATPALADAAPTPPPADAPVPGAALPALGAPALLVGLAAAVVLRVAVAGAGGAASAPAGALFGGVLLVLAGLGAAGQRRAGHGRRLGAGLRTGVLTGLALAALPAVRAWVSPSSGGTPRGFWTWAVVVTLVAVAEEALLRGALFTAVQRWRGDLAAVLVTAAAFAALHAPLYGARVLPLDAAVGVVLGGLRVWTGSVAAPAAAHTVADLAGWWLR